MNSNKSILLVDNDPGLLRLLSIRLTSAGFNVKAVESGPKALATLKVYRPHILITDLRMQDMDGLALFKAVQNEFPTLPVIILTAHGSIEQAVEATKNGVFSFLTKPYDSHILIQQIEKAVQLSGDTHDTVSQEKNWHEQIITRSQRMLELLSQARMIAASDVSVFIHGESGTGKELLARAIHEASPRAKQPFVAFNCGTIPDTLLESELFGHRRGAFTGATHSHEGLFQAADQGTLLLDEIGDMPPALQVKLLRVLQERTVRPLGATEDIPIDVRIISATHQDLEQQMQVGRFREDLYYRLNVISLMLPPLRERREDIPLLIKHFLQILNTKYRKQITGFSTDALELMINTQWPGNIRQLYHITEQLLTLTATPIISATQVQQALKAQPIEIPSFAEARQQFERDYLAQLMKITGGNVSQAAKLAKRNRTEFYRLLDRHDLKPELFKL